MTFLGHNQKTISHLTSGHVILVVLLIDWNPMRCRQADLYKLRVAVGWRFFAMHTCAFCLTKEKQWNRTCHENASALQHYSTVFHDSKLNKLELSLHALLHPAGMVVSALSREFIEDESQDPSVREDSWPTLLLFFNIKLLNPVEASHKRQNTGTQRFTKDELNK